MTALSALGEKLFPREKLRLRFLERIRKRRGSVSMPFELEYRHIFVLPTIFGFGFGFMLLSMALGGLNFSNNMALLLVFLLGGISQITTVLAYRNMVGLRIDSVRVEAVFSGEPALFHVYVTNPEARPRLAIQGGFREAQDCFDLALISTGRLTLKQTTQKRGWLPMACFRLETRYPLGMFKAWAWIFPQAKCLVYPKPALRPPPLPRTGEGPVGIARKGEGEQVHGLREYRQGDSPRRIAWRASARHGDLYTREMETPRDGACELNWDDLAGTETETRLSILTAWVIMADHRQLPFSLSLPGVRVPGGLGIEHRNCCLQLLALHGL